MSRQAEYAAWMILTFALVCGVALRLRMFLMHRSLWLDPAMLALNVVQRGYAELFDPLSMNQAAPVGFLLASKVIGSLTGYSDVALMVLPFCFAVGALALFLPLSLEVLGLQRAPLAFVPFATSSTAIYYAGEFKQYSGDLFFAVLLLLVAYRNFTSETPRRAIVAFTVVALVAVWFSHPAVFVIAGAAAALSLDAALRHDGRRVGALVPAVGVLALHYTALYLLQIRPAAHGALFSYHAHGYAPAALHSWDGFAWWWTSLIGYASYPLGFGSWIVLPLVCLAVGAVVVLATSAKRRVGFLLLLPILVLWLASVLHLYPIHTGQHDVNSRLVLFTLPVGFLLIGAAISWLADVSPRPVPVVLILGAALILPSVAHIGSWPRFIRQEMRPLAADLARELDPHDSVYVYFAAVPAFKFYILHNPIPYREGRPAARPAADLAEYLTDEGIPNRLWVVVAHDFRDERVAMRQHLQSRYKSVTTRKYVGAWLILAENPRAAPRKDDR